MDEYEKKTVIEDPNGLDTISKELELHNSNKD